MTGESIRSGVNIGVRPTFSDLAATFAKILGVRPTSQGTSFKAKIMG